MAEPWDTAEMLLALVGDGDAAATAARDMGEDCRRGGRAREAAFWDEVAMAALWLANPQPLIAPRLPPAARPASASIHRLRFAERLPRERRRLIERALRNILERRRGEDAPEDPEREG